MEVTIIKKLFLTVDVADGLTEEELESVVDDIINSAYADEWEETDWTGHTSYEVYDTYSGVTLMEKGF